MRVSVRVRPCVRARVCVCVRGRRRAAYVYGTAHTVHAMLCVRRALRMVLQIGLIRLLSISVFETETTVDSILSKARPTRN